MARKLRLEEEGAVYHVINRGNYRADIFVAEKTRRAFLKCLGETCERTGWVVHAWCIMRNHYHVAIRTPQGNLVEGMQWLQGTFATRFNRLRKESGHLFQGRYKALVVDPESGLGSLCHYIHLNPVRARVCPVVELAEWPWTSVRGLMQPKTRPAWFDPEPALQHAGGLKDTPHGRRKYLDYLSWLAEDEPGQKALNFETMSSGWIIGSAAFKREAAKDYRAAVRRTAIAQAEVRAAREAAWAELLATLLRRLRRTAGELAAEGKSASWKLGVAAVMKAHTTATNRWLAEQLHLGNMFEASRKISAWSRTPDPKLAKRLAFTPSPKG